MLRFLNQQDRAWRRKVGQDAMENFARRPLEGILSLGNYYRADIVPWSGRVSYRFHSNQLPYGDPRCTAFGPYVSAQMIADYRLAVEDTLFETSHLLSSDYTVALRGFTFN